LPSLCQVFPAEAERRRTNSDPVRVHLLRIGLRTVRAQSHAMTAVNDCQFGRLLVHPISPVVSNRSWLVEGNIAWVGVLTRLNVPEHANSWRRFMRQPIRVAHTLRIRGGTVT